MSIKIQCRLKLPYIIRLKEEKDYEKEFNFPEFPYFKLTLLFNDPSYEAIYLEDYNQKSCQFIQLEVITDKFDYNNYNVNKLRKVVHGNVSYVEHDVKNVPEVVEMEIMKAISLRVNQIIKFIREKSKMFWLEDISINPTSDMLGVFTSYYFYAPTAELDKYMTYSITTIDNYMESDSGVGGSKIYDSFFEDFETFVKSKYNTSFQFLDKAKSSLYDLRIYEAIIFAAIAEESFITKYIEDNAPQNDIIFNKLNEINGHLMELKYNVILKYLKGNSLLEIKKIYWDAVSGIYKLRNFIMHSGEISSEQIQKSGFTDIKFATIERALKRIEKAFLEIEKL